MSRFNQNISLQTGTADMQVTLFAQKLGKDLAVIITGGTHPHIGAVALAQQHPSLSNENTSSATTSLLVIPPHKEGDIAQDVARRLAIAYECNVTVTAGIHVDKATSADIKQLLGNTEELVQKLLASQFIVRDNK